MTRKQRNRTADCGNRTWLIVCLLFAFVSFTRRGFSQPVTVQKLALPICQWKDPREHASIESKNQAILADTEFKKGDYENAILHFQEAYLAHPLCHFLAPIIVAHIRLGDCDAATHAMRALTQTDGEFLVDRLNSVRRWERSCSPVSGAPEKPVAPMALSPPQVPLPKAGTAVEIPAPQVPAPLVPKESLPVPLAAPVRARTPMERSPWYRKSWPWLTAGGVAVTAAGIGIGIGVWARHGQATGIPHSALYDSPEAASLARSVH